MKRLALLNPSEETRWLVRRWQTMGMWRVARMAGSAVEEGMDEFPDGAYVDVALWHEGLEADALLVAGPVTEEQFAVLKELATRSVPMVFVHPALESLAAYELAMHAGPQWSALVWYPQRRPPWESLETPWRETVGTVRQVRWSSAWKTPSPEAVMEDVVRAAHWCLPLVGRYRSLQAVQPISSQDRIQWDRLNLTVVGDREVTLVWQARSAGSTAPEETHVTLEGDSGELELRFDRAGRLWMLGKDNVEIPGLPSPAEDAAEAIGGRLEACAQGQDSGDNWSQVCQTLEVFDLIEHSVRRRRMVDLVQEAPTEETAFKGVMAAGSCALLLIVLAIFCFGALWESVYRTRPRPGESTTAAHDGSAPVSSVRWWRFWPVFPLAAYLLLQLLILVARQSRPKREASGGGRHEEESERQDE
ncbi:MAG TPA: hypothetical protein ENJ50_02620 [Planctomycetaceae bacterium]|nr:hypothetical protein [Planctomycetaceae bacterium]